MVSWESNLFLKTENILLFIFINSYAGYVSSHSTALELLTHLMSPLGYGIRVAYPARLENLVFHLFRSQVEYQCSSLWYDSTEN